MPTVTVQSTLKAALDMAHQTMESTMADVTDEIANRPAAGAANPIGSSYAHAVLVEDGVVHGLLQGQFPLMAGVWAGRTGVDKPMPMPGLLPGDIGEWYHSVHVDMAACRAYAQAVYAASSAFLDAADDATMARGVDMSMIGLPTMPVADVFAGLVIGHTNNLCGEISAIKGSHGLKGYPF
jgi:hypothetical protein